MNMSSFGGCCDAGDVIDGQQCIISITRGSAGNVNRFLRGVGVHVNDRKEVTTGRENSVRLGVKGRCVSLKTFIIFEEPECCGEGGRQAQRRRTW